MLHVHWPRAKNQGEGIGWMQEQGRPVIWLLNIGHHFVASCCELWLGGL